MFKNRNYNNASQKRLAKFALIKYRINFRNYGIHIICCCWEEGDGSGGGYCVYKFLPPRVAVTPPGMAREDWKIIRALSEVHSMESYIIHTAVFNIINVDTVTYTCRCTDIRTYIYIYVYYTHCGL